MVYSTEYRLNIYSLSSLFYLCFTRRPNFIGIGVVMVFLDQKVQELLGPGKTLLGTTGFLWSFNYVNQASDVLRESKYSCNTLPDQKRAVRRR